MRPQWRPRRPHSAAWRSVTRTIRQEVTAAFTQRHATRAGHLHAGGAGGHARTWSVRQTYTLGRATLLDAIAEQRRYIDIETGYTEALKQAYDAAVDIERAIGALERRAKGKVHAAER